MTTAEFERIAAAASRIELMLVYEQSLQSMHDELVTRGGLSEEEFFFSYAAALCRISRMQRQANE